MTRKKNEVPLPNEVIYHISRFFNPPWRRNLAKGVSRQWDEAIVPCHRFFILGSPILIKANGKFEKEFSPAIAASFNSIPNDGFLIFPTYQDAYLYAHNAFTRARDNPNFNNGIHGTGCLLESFLVTNQIPADLYHPVIFEVVFNATKLLEISWHNFILLNLGNQDSPVAIKFSAIREGRSKEKLIIISSKIALEFINNQSISPIVLYDSQAISKREQLEIESNPKSERRCLCM